MTDDTPPPVARLINRRNPGQNEAAEQARQENAAAQGVQPEPEGPPGPSARREGYAPSNDIIPQMEPRELAPERNQTAQPIQSGHYRDLFKRFETNGVHPVMIFGTGKSGKTLMLQSLFYDARKKYPDRVGAKLGKSIFPPDYPDAVRRYEHAENLINSGLRDFDNGVLAGQTQVGEPFFVPVDFNITHPDGNEETLHFAFLESVGEWFYYESAENRRFRPLHPEIAAILKNHTGPMSIIFVVPTVAGSDDQDFNNHMACIANAMDNYVNTREKRDRDSVLLLISKWDAKFWPGARQFGAPAAAEIVKLIKNWYAVWTTFARNVSGVHPEGKSMMPYAAAWINEEGRMLEQKEHEPVFAAFNKTLLNWLYANAKSTYDETDSDGKVRAILFPDVVPEDPSTIRVSWLGRLFTFKPWN